MKFFNYLGLLLLLLISNLTSKAAVPTVEFPEIVVAGVEVKTIIDCKNPEEKEITITYNGLEKTLPLTNGKAIIVDSFDEESLLRISIGDFVFEEKINPIPLWWSILPPLIAIFMALVFKEVLSSLLIGIFFGACVIYCYSDGFYGLLLAFMALIDNYIVDALFDEGHISIILFSLLIGGMVSIVSKNGGMQAVVNKISKIAKGPVSGQFATWTLGVAIFFDDYANTLVVGNTMRPLTDKLRISREKLAYLVDSTAAPIAAIAFITTWIGAELSYIEDGINNIDGLNEGVYATFISSLKYSFYPILTLLFMLMLIFKKKDFGPMLKAENRSRLTGEVGEGVLANDAAQQNNEFTAKAGIPLKAYNAVIPVLTVVLGTIAGLLYTGWDVNVWDDESLTFGRKISTVIGNADSYKALLWSSLASLIIAMALSISQKIMDLRESIDSMMHGFSTMLPAIMILTLAWALALITEHLHTADFLTYLLSDNISVYFIPSITFILGAVVAFSTGSSWGTMAILYPLMLPAAWKISQDTGLDYQESLSIFHNVVACVLAGSVLGDHCSPISDTTILSSLSSSCNHIAHVRTQIPYALTVGGVSILFGTIPSAFGLPIWLNFVVALAVLYLIVHFYAKKLEVVADVE